MGVLPSSYLGLSLGGPYNSMVLWDGVEESFHKMLLLLKRNTQFQG